MKAIKTVLIILLSFLWISTEAQSAKLPSYLPANGLIGWWPFNGNANDESGNNRHGLVNGVRLCADRTGNGYKAYQWEVAKGNEQYISLGNISSAFTGSSSFSFSAWIYADNGLGFNPRIISFGGNHPGIWSIGKENTKRQFSGFWPPSGGTFVSNEISALAWHHIVFTADVKSGLTCFYVDGIPNTNSCCAKPDPSSFINGIWEIGRQPASEVWGGRIDDIGIWNRALSANEVIKLYSYSYTPANQTNKIPAESSNSEVPAGYLRDIDGYVYKTVKIGNQTWMSENLRVTHFNDGTPIAYLKSDQQWMAAGYPAWCIYDNNPVNDPMYGKLYNWRVANDKKNVCPVGWHVSSEQDWSTLMEFLNPELIPVLKNGSTPQSFKFGAQIQGYSYDFSILLGGMRLTLPQWLKNSSSFIEQGQKATWWTPQKKEKTEPNIKNKAPNILIRGVCLKLYGMEVLSSELSDFTDGASLRCVKD